MLPGTEAIIFVIDSCDRLRLPEVVDDLQWINKRDDVRNASLLILCNKQDLEDAMPASELREKLGLDTVLDSTCRQWRIQGSSATTGDGLYEGLDWLCQAIRRLRSGEFVPAIKAVYSNSASA